MSQAVPPATAAAQPRRRPGILSGDFHASSLPWWAFILLAAGLTIAYLILANDRYHETFNYLATGVVMTLRITVFSYTIATVIGLITGLARTSKGVIPYTISTLYVETVRGVPLIVLILYTAFIIIPGVAGVIAGIGRLGTSLGLGEFFSNLQQTTSRDINLELRAIIALGFGYGAYEAEIFRAGIQSIGRGQMEAARSLGMTYAQAMQHVILPQAIRRVLPPLGNDFIACLKDSSLATVLAVNELTQLGRLRRSSTFRVFETFNVLTFLYLAMTLLLSAAVRWLERRMKFEE